MPSIVFTNSDGESLEINLENTSNSEALKKGSQHLDKPLNKKLFNEFTNRVNKKN
tara:strand:- start:381 stop:545 length:165 start_codon:yes stop_codon:yes gene_type:complete